MEIQVDNSKESFSEALGVSQSRQKEIQNFVKKVMVSEKDKSGKMSVVIEAICKKYKKDNEVIVAVFYMSWLVDKMETLMRMETMQKVLSKFGGGVNGNK